MIIVFQFMLIIVIFIASLRGTLSFLKRIVKINIQTNQLASIGGSFDIKAQTTPIPNSSINIPIDRQEINKVQEFGIFAYDSVSKLAVLLSNKPSFSVKDDDRKTSITVSTAIQKLSRDVEFLDDVASRTPQLTRLEVAVLSAAVLASAISPTIFDTKVIEVFIPAMAALSASVGISAEYMGKVAVSNGKEVTALAIQAAAEAEALLAVAERSKALLPLCVGIATTASVFSLVAPSLFQDLKVRYGFEIMLEVYLLCPLVAVLAAAVAGLASQESRSLASKAKGIGNRRFASSKSVGRTWMSVAEQVESASKKTTEKWSSFAFGVAPAPVIAALCPGTLEFKSILCASIAAAQAAYYLSIAEFTIAAAVDSVALKARSAALADTYANQGSRAGAILPFTSALAGLCAAASTAVVELLPFVHMPILQSLIAVTFPLGASLFSAAASVSKARCEADAAAASEAVSTLGDEDKLPGGVENDPRKAVFILIKLSIRTTSGIVFVRMKQFRNLVYSGLLIKKLQKKMFRFCAQRYYYISIKMSSFFSRKSKR